MMTEIAADPLEFVYDDHDDSYLQTQLKTYLAQYLRINKNFIITQQNREKYYDKRNPQSTTVELTEIFQLMRDLNKIAVEDCSLAVDKYGNLSFRECLDLIAADAARHFGTQPFIYLELGPEPYKTRQLIRTMQDHGANVAAYVAVDINPASTQEMAQTLRSLMPESLIHQRTQDFETLSPNDVRVADLPILMTMLGFEEANQHPFSARKLFDRLLRPGDCVLSEMQVLDPQDPDVIHRVYKEPIMRRFSYLSLQRVFPGAESQFRFFHIPIDIGIGEETEIVILCEKLISGTPYDGSYFVTNYTLKFTNEQFRRIREGGGFEIRAERQTGDLSVVFHLSRRSAIDAKEPNPRL